MLLTSAAKQCRHVPDMAASAYEPFVTYAERVGTKSSNNAWSIENESEVTAKSRPTIPVAVTTASKVLRRRLRGPIANPTRLAGTIHYFDSHRHTRRPPGPKGPGRSLRVFRASLDGPALTILIGQYDFDWPAPELFGFSVEGDNFIADERGISPVFGHSTRQAGPPRMRWSRMSTFVRPFFCTDI
jgi:hypothetical protein